jgi:hypothetical protein
LGRAGEVGSGEGRVGAAQGGDEAAGAGVGRVSPAFLAIIRPSHYVPAEQEG